MGSRWGNSARSGLLTWVAAVFLALLLWGCSGAQQLAVDAAVGPQGGPLQNGVTSAPGYKLGEGEKVRITVFNEPQLSGAFAIDGSGQIALPLIGQVQAVGSTARELERYITEKLKGRFLVNPRVTVEILSHRPFYIIGEVKSAGEYPYKTGLNVVSAVALAGGFAPRASTSYVYIKRVSEAQEREFPALPSVAVFPGDIIRVPERYF
jgi:polysaccharide export outer membrane protein